VDLDTRTEGKEGLQEREEGGEPPLGLGDAAVRLALAGGPESAGRTSNKPRTHTKNQSLEPTYESLTTRESESRKEATYEESALDLDFMEAGGKGFAEGRVRAPATTVRSSEKLRAELARAWFGWGERARARERGGSWVAAKPAGEWLGSVIFEKVNDEEVMRPGSTTAQAARRRLLKFVFLPSVNIFNNTDI
jgi:hypothetical protein